MFNLRKENMSNPESIDEIVSADTKKKELYMPDGDTINPEADLEEILRD